MSLNISLNKENLKYLNYVNKISDLEKNNFLNYIFNLGFKEYIKIKNSKINKSFTIENSDNNDLLISNINNKLDINTNQIINILNELKFNNLNKSINNKGNEGELQIYNFFQINFNNFIIEDTSQIAHSADFKVFIPEINQNILLEVKNYKNTVDQKQIDKLYYDLNYTGINYAIFISLQSGIVNKKNNIEWDINNNRIIIFISNCTNELLFLSIYTLINLYNTVIKNKNNINISYFNNKTILNNINNLIQHNNQIIKLKNSILNLHKNYSNDILELYNSICFFENTLNYNLNNLKYNIDSEINKYKLIETNNNKILLEIEELQLTKINNNLLQNIISDIQNKLIIKIINNKKIILYNKNIEIIELKILKNSINLLFLNDNLEIKNLSCENWNKIFKMIEIEYLNK